MVSRTGKGFMDLFCFDSSIVHIQHHISFRCTTQGLNNCVPYKVIANLEAICHCAVITILLTVCMSSCTLHPCNLFTLTRERIFNNNKRKLSCIIAEGITRSSGCQLKLSSRLTLRKNSVALMLSGEALVPKHQ